MTRAPYSRHAQRSHTSGAERSPYYMGSLAKRALEHVRAPYPHDLHVCKRSKPSSPRAPQPHDPRIFIYIFICESPISTWLCIYVIDQNPHHVEPHIHIYAYIYSYVTAPYSHHIYVNVRAPYPHDAHIFIHIFICDSPISTSHIYKCKSPISTRLAYIHICIHMTRTYSHVCECIFMNMCQSCASRRAPYPHIFTYI